VINLVEPDVRRRPITMRDLRWAVAGLFLVATVAGLAFAIVGRMV